jgi:tRNA 2-thiouridine synthesizing protein E
VEHRLMKARVLDAPVPVHPHHLRTLMVDGQAVEVDVEGYLVDRSQWTPAFAEALAAREGLTLTDAHWLVLRFIRNHWRTRGRVASLRAIVRHFRPIWGEERGSTAAIFRLFEAGGGPEKLGNRLAGVPRAKGDA